VSSDERAKMAEYMAMPDILKHSINGPLSGTTRASWHQNCQKH